MTVLTIKSIHILSLAKVLGLLYALLGFIVGSLLTCVSLLGATAALSESGAEAGPLGVLFGLGSIIILPIFYGVIGFIGGIITAFLYNLIAGWVGGIEIETV
jgi:hypothetical protein